MTPLPSPHHVVIGATDIRRACDFYERLGFAFSGRGALTPRQAKALYGIEAELQEALLTMPGATRGAIRLVSTPHPATAPGAFDRGAHAIDIYTTDIERSLKLAEHAGALGHGIGAYRVGPLQIQEAKVVAPDHSAIVFIQVDRRRPSLLDADPSRLHSEVHSAVFALDSVSGALSFWKDKAGLGLLLDATIREPAVARFMGLPRPDCALRLAVLADGAQQPIRLELLEFPEDAGPLRPGWPLAGGLFGIAFAVDSIDAARAAWPEIECGSRVALDTSLHPRSAALTGLGPGRVRLELWEGL